MTERICTHEGCDKPHRAKGLCSTHYNQWRYDPATRHRKERMKCDWGGSLIARHVSRTVLMRFCSYRCRDDWALAERKGRHNPERTKPLGPKQKARAIRLTKRSIVEAITSGEFEKALASIAALAPPNEAGCWIWPWARGDYGVIAGQAAHRVSLSASLGAALDDQPVHHRCAQRSCVNPDHLQLVTTYDNAAEMMARNYYERRIARLEHALREIDPTHPALS